MGIFDFFTRPPAPAKFAALFMACASEQGLTQQMAFDADEFAILLGDKRDQVINLHNVYRDYCRAKRRDRAAVLNRFIASLNAPDLPATWAEARAHIMPLLRSRAQLEYIRLMSQLQNASAPYRELAQPFGDDALVMLGYDSELNIVTLAGEHLERWQVSFDQALAVAMENLRDRTADQFTDLGEGVLAGQWDDAFDTSRILLSDLAYRAAAGRTRIGSEPVLMIPTRGCFLLTSASNSAGLAHMLACAQQAIEQEGRFVSSAMYRLQEGKIVSFQPGDPELVRQLGNLKRLCLRDDYASQGALLEKMVQCQQTEVFVAQCQLLENRSDGSLTSYCTWVKGVEILLPQTDWVALVVPVANGEISSSKMVEWHALQAEAGHLMQPEPGYPLRYRVSGFPADEQIARLPPVWSA